MTWNPALPMSWRNRPAHAAGLGRRDYYRFLRIVYGFTAAAAWERARVIP